MSRRRSRGARSGRAQALAVLDRLVAGKKSQKAIIAALEERLQENPLLFFRKVVMPLLPRDETPSADFDGVVEWRSLLGKDDAGRQQGEVAP